MSQHVAQLQISETLEVIRVEQASPPGSILRYQDSKTDNVQLSKEKLTSAVTIQQSKTGNVQMTKEKRTSAMTIQQSKAGNVQLSKEKRPSTMTIDNESQKQAKKISKPCPECCGSVKSKPAEPRKPETPKVELKEVERMLAEKEDELRSKFDQNLLRATNALKERFDFILRNEQVRTSNMLCEAHRERQEKITALQTQLECKNLAGLMYVMCSERAKCKMDRLQLIQDYTNYINVLQNILTEGQELILNLSRGYKTAARVDHEWREKMKKVIAEYQAFVCHFANATPEQTQYFFDLPNLLKTEAPIEDNPKEDPCDEPIPSLEPPEEWEENKTWWAHLEGACKPFVVFGDMGDFDPDKRREVIKTIKAEREKIAPLKWKKYNFNEMFIKSGCPNADKIKDVYFDRLPAPAAWDCQAQAQAPRTDDDVYFTGSPTSRRATFNSIDVRGMGSLLKIITSTQKNVPTKATSTLLGARDSMELASTTKLRERSQTHRNSEHPSKVILNIGSRRTSFFEDYDVVEEESENKEKPSTSVRDVQSKFNKLEEDESLNISKSPLMGRHNDSLNVIPKHVPDQDHKINYEKICPVDKCQRLKMDSFVRSLPPYMQANPYTHFEQSYEEYEPCSTEQLDMLKQRIEARKQKSFVKSQMGMTEWTPSIEGIAVQTTESLLSIPPCTCHDHNNSPASTTSSNGLVFRLADLIPVKQTLDEITHECLFDSQIQFDRFKVLGQHSKEAIPAEPKKEFTLARLDEIRKILKKHPSLCEIFQANTKC